MNSGPGPMRIGFGDGNIAASRREAEHPVWPNSGAFDGILSRPQFDVGRVSGYDFGSAVLIQQVGAIQMMQEGLAVIAIALEPSRRIFRKPSEFSAERSAFALNFH